LLGIVVFFDFVLMLFIVVFGFLRFIYPFVCGQFASRIECLFFSKFLRIFHIFPFISFQVRIEPD